jgi:putative holliday junction resolvase
MTVFKTVPFNHSGTPPGTHYFIFGFFSSFCFFVWFYAFKYNVCYDVPMRYLGIDYGSKRVGLALSDEGGTLAFPYKILANDMSLVDVVHNMCGEEEVSAIVIGESRDLSGAPNKIMGSIEEFKRNLEVGLDLPIYFQAEFMTTIEARGREGKEQNNARKTKKGEQSKADASAAALILQRFLDKKNQKYIL